MLYWYHHGNRLHTTVYIESIVLETLNTVLCAMSGPQWSVGLYCGIIQWPIQSLSKSANQIFLTTDSMLLIIVNSLLWVYKSLIDFSEFKLLKKIGYGVLIILLKYFSIYSQGQHRSNIFQRQRSFSDSSFDAPHFDSFGPSSFDAHI